MTAKLVWERDGEERVDTWVIAWSGRSVLIRVEDRRRQMIGLWLSASDVERREELR